jgi:hypothetical protein
VGNCGRIRSEEYRVIELKSAFMLMLDKGRNGPEKACRMDRYCEGPRHYVGEFWSFVQWRRPSRLYQL